ncbi:DUF1489 family protein [Erythrobacteraceae bacterium CFH 75059]|uniref:DUF1489 family protein n=1 Tax=Qipengyuania thermophila TaxID=2509361 RepID=UPI00102196F9|nr:DUF1489 family protein [Qipengyuania thermophila]TCD04886.1 DUF1489 family protein [Erythrobacteraceae bacterium CFH 75059]
MPLHLTKIAFGARSFEDIESWFAGRPRLSVNTRYRPSRWEHCIGGSLFWIHQHMLVARSPIAGFSPQPDGRWFIDLEAQLIRVQPRPRRAHQGWRYLEAADAPADLAPGEAAGDLLPPRLGRRLAELGLV